MKHTIPYSSIIVTGSISWDIIMNFPNKFVDYLQPDMLHQINVSFVVNTLEKQMGGTGTNISFAVSQAAKQMSNVKCQISNQIPVYLLGGIGKDGKEQIKFFKKHGINTNGIVNDKNLYCASGTVITDRKDNQIWGFYYGACVRGKDAQFKRFVKKDSVMIISANHPDAFLKAQQYAIKHNIAYMYDCGMAMSWIQKKDLEQGIENCTWLVGNDYEIALICKTIGKTVKELMSMGIEVITTLGEKGVRYESKVKGQMSQLRLKASMGEANVKSTNQILNPKNKLNPNQISNLKSPFEKTQGKQISNNQQQTITIPAYQVKKVVDPTGAGDAWRGGFLAAFCSGADIQTCLKIGNVMASFAIESYGTVNYRVKRQEFEKRLKKI